MTSPTIDDYRWLTSPAGIHLWQSLQSEIHSGDILPSTIQNLRRRLSASQAALLIEQTRLAKIAARKFSDPRQWFWTQQLLEQSSDEQTARETADDFPIGSSVIDCCCGAGADAIAMASSGKSVIAVDRCEIACALTQHNASSLNAQIAIVQADIELLPGPDDALISSHVCGQSFLHIDPDRRADGARSTSLSRLSPNWETVQRLSTIGQGMSLKLAPGTKTDSDVAIELSEMPNSKRWLSRDGSVRQQRWYWGIDRWPTDTTSVSMQMKNMVWHHETFLDRDVAESEMTDAIISTVGRFIADYDPVVRAAGVTVVFAEKYGLQLIETRNGYLTGDEPVPHPMIRYFEVLDVLPLDRKKLRSYARSLKVRSWELKSRSIEIDLDAWRRELPVDSDSELSATILFTRIADRHRAIVARSLL
jgi:SAM-dependent methyltransferase